MQLSTPHEAHDGQGAPEVKPNGVTPNVVWPRLEIELPRKRHGVRVVVIRQPAGTVLNPQDAEVLVGKEHLARTQPAEVGLELVHELDQSILVGMETRSHLANRDQTPALLGVNPLCHLGRYVLAVVLVL